MAEKCSICYRHPRSKFAKYCQDCSKLINRANRGKERAARRDAVKDAWKDGAFRCSYSEVELELFDSSSPFYFTFDHATPGSGQQIVACAQFINDMKSDMTKDEFKHNVLELAHRFKTGERLNRSDFRLEHFNRNNTMKK